jgi:hypothetical protein
VQPTANNMLNLLLGVTSKPTGAGVAGTASAQVPGDTLFGDLLGLLGVNASGSAGRVDTEAKSSELPIFPPLVKKDNFGPGSLPLMIPVSFIQDIAQASFPNGTSGMLSAEAKPEATLVNALAAKDSGKLPDASGWPIMPRPISSFGAALSELAGNSPVLLNNGTYTILSAKQVDDKLNLEVTSKDNPGQIIKLTLPLNFLQANPTVSTDAGQAKSSSQETGGKNSERVALKGVPAPTTTIEQLLPKLNLKEMEVRFDQPRAAVAPMPTEVQVTITAMSGNRPLLLAGVISRNDLQKAVKQTPGATINNDLKITDSDGGDADDTGAVSRITKSSKSAIEPVATKDNSLNWAQLDKRTMFDVIDQSAKDAPTQQVDFTNGDVSAKTTEQKFNQPAVRFTLPDNLAQAMKSRSQSVMIKIEPEHLGPARLNLSIRNDVLTARLTVDTSQAKAAVEGSLDRLTEQLSRAGIKVNHIEVSLRGGDSQNQFAGRQSGWFRPQRFNVRSTDDNFLSTVIAPVVPLPILSPGYAGSGGVNLYA